MGRAANDGNGGFVFSIDATLAVFIMILAVVVAVLLVSQGAGDPYGGTQASLVAKDTLFALDYQGMLSSQNSTAITAALSSALPSNIGAQLYITTYAYNGTAFVQSGAVIAGQTAPYNSTTYGSQYDFVSMYNGTVQNYSVARMTVWQQ
jgi:hypothetical protein